MIEKKYQFTISENKTIEKVVEDDYVAINHIILTKGDVVPEHFSNSNVYLIVVRGIATLKFNTQDEHIYHAGSILNVPYKTKMNVSNQHDEVMEFFVFKAPSPKNFKEE
ncbi:MAG: cupin domain-containing protein [Eubacteriales bacterium]